MGYRENKEVQIVQFVPQMGVEARENIQRFISLVREKVLVFGNDLPWEENVWPITEHLSQKRGKVNRQVFSFVNFDTAGSKRDAMPMSKPFLDFAKAYMRYGCGLNKRENHGQKLAAIRAVEKVLSMDSNDGIPRVEKISPEILNRAVLVLQNRNPGSAYQSGCHLEILARFLNENQMLMVRFSWINPITRKKDLGIGIGKDFDEKRKNKLPSEAAICALPQIFQTATSPVDIIISSMAAIMLCSPERFNEIYVLPNQCEREDMDSEGNDVFGLVWEASKGGGPQINWIPSQMVDVCKEALKKLREQTAEARQMAQWYEKNPGRLYLPPDLSFLRAKEFLSPEELSKLLGMPKKSYPYRWAHDHAITSIKVKNKTGTGASQSEFRFADVEKAIINMLPNTFPVLDKRTGLKYSEALLVIPYNLLHPKRGTYRCLFKTISINDFNSQVGAAAKHDKSSIFSRNGFSEPDGSPVVLSSHKFRHLLTNLALKKDLGYLVATLWRKSKNMEQTKSYDHRTPEDFLDRLKLAPPEEMHGPIAEIVMNAPVSREEFIDMMYPCVHTTQFGFCVHDWQLLPCQRGRDCLNCTSHICVKGDNVKTERIKQELKDAEDQLVRDNHAILCGELGADIWFENNTKKVARLRQLINILDDPTIPEGALIQLHSEDEFSFIGHTIEIRRQLGDSDAELLSQVRASKGRDDLNTGIIPALLN